MDTASSKNLLRGESGYTADTSAEAEMRSRTLKRTILYRWMFFTGLLTFICGVIFVKSFLVLLALVIPVIGTIMLLMRTEPCPKCGKPLRSHGNVGDGKILACDSCRMTVLSPLAYYVWEKDDPEFVNSCREGSKLVMVKKFAVRLFGAVLAIVFLLLIIPMDSWKHLPLIVFPFIAYYASFRLSVFSNKCGQCGGGMTLYRAADTLSLCSVCEACKVKFTETSVARDFEAPDWRNLPDYPRVPKNFQRDIVPMGLGLSLLLWVGILLIAADFLKWYSFLFVFFLSGYLIISHYTKLSPCKKCGGNAERYNSDFLPTVKVCHQCGLRSR